MSFIAAMTHSALGQVDAADSLLGSLDLLHQNTICEGDNSVLNISRLVNCKVSEQD